MLVIILFVGFKLDFMWWLYVVCFDVVWINSCFCFLDFLCLFCVVMVLLVLDIVFLKWFSRLIRVGVEVYVIDELKVY